jgi:hypothetical protein
MTYFEELCKRFYLEIIVEVFFIIGSRIQFIPSIGKHLLTFVLWFCLYGELYVRIFSVQIFIMNFSIQI